MLTESGALVVHRSTTSFRGATSGLDHTAPIVWVRESLNLQTGMPHILHLTQAMINSSENLQLKLEFQAEIKKRKSKTRNNVDFVLRFLHRVIVSMLPYFRRQILPPSSGSKYVDWWLTVYKERYILKKGVKRGYNNLHNIYPFLSKTEYYIYIEAYQSTHIDPEDGVIIYLRNVGSIAYNHAVQQPKNISNIKYR
jgi:hypothetical protein